MIELLLVFLGVALHYAATRKAAGHVPCAVAVEPDPWVTPGVTGGVAPCTAPGVALPLRRIP